MTEIKRYKNPIRIRITFKISVGNILTFKTFSKIVFLNEQEYTIGWITMYNNTNMRLSRTIIPYHIH